MKRLLSLILAILLAFTFVSCEPDPVKVSSVALDKESLEIQVGSKETLKATVLPSDAVDKTVTWTTSDDKVVTVDNGVVTAVGTGEATITAEAGDKTVTCTVTVVLPIAESVSLDKSEILLNKLEKNDDLRHEQVLKAKVLPELADQSVTWTSSNTELVTVDENGLVKAVYDKEGTATITASTGNGKEATCTVYVGKVDFKMPQESGDSWEGGNSFSYEYLYSIPELAEKTTSTLTSSDATLCKLDPEAMTVTLAAVTENKTFDLTFENREMGICHVNTVTVYPKAEKIWIDISKGQHYMFKSDPRAASSYIKTVPENAYKLVYNKHFNGLENPKLQGNVLNNRVQFECGETHFQLESHMDKNVKSDEYEIFVSPGRLDDDGYWWPEKGSDTVYLPTELDYPDSTGKIVRRQVKGIGKYGESWGYRPYYPITNIIIVGDFMEFDIPSFAFDTSPLRKINIPSNTTVGYKAFVKSKNLESVFVGKNVTFDTNVFDGCTALKTIWMEETAPDDNSRPAWAPEGVEIVYGKTFDEFWPERWKPSSEQTPSV